MALYHLLSVFRQMTWSALAARSNSSIEWRKAHYQISLVSNNPRGHTLGIIGLGNIGLAIAKKVRAALDMRILYHDVVRKSATQEQEIEATYYEDLDDLLRVSECVLVATPHTGHPLLNARTLALLPPGARIVNIARGSLVDEDALADALESGHVAAAGLDVHVHEPVVSERLSAMRNVTLTSHTAGSSVETVTGFERLVLENVGAVLNGERALTAVNAHLIREEAEIGVVNGHENGDLHNGGLEGQEGAVNGGTTNGDA